MVLMRCCCFCCVWSAAAGYAQVEFANVLVLNKTDLITQQEQQQLLALLKTLNPSAKVLTSQHCSVPVEAVLHTHSFNWEAAQGSPGWVQAISRFEHQHGHQDHHDQQHQHHQGHHDHQHEHEHDDTEMTKYGISSFVYYAQRPFHPGRLLNNALSQTWQGVLRSKGFYWLATRHDVMGLWQSAGGAWQGEPRCVLPC
jgi:G3E family GTPase